MKKYELTALQGKNVIIDISQLLSEDVLYINATKLSKQFGKSSQDLYKFLNTKSFKEYKDAVNRIAIKGDTIDNILVKKNPRGTYAGTYIHSNLIIYFLRWLDVEFAIECDLFIKHKIQEAHDEQIAIKAAVKANLANEQFFKFREQGKVTHKSFSDVLQQLCRYAEDQRGDSYNGKCPYYTLMQSAINKVLGVKSRSKDALTPEQLESIELLEYKICKTIVQCMDDNVLYKDIYFLCKDKLLEVTSDIESTDYEVGNSL